MKTHDARVVLVERFEHDVALGGGVLGGKNRGEDADEIRDGDLANAADAEGAADGEILVVDVEADEDQRNVGRADVVWSWGREETSCSKNPFFLGRHFYFQRFLIRHTHLC